MSHSIYTQKHYLLLSFLLFVLSSVTGSSVTGAPAPASTDQPGVPPLTAPDCPEHELELPHEKLQTLCQHIIAHKNLHFDYSMRKAAVTLLQGFIAKHPSETIERCVVLTPEGGNVDEQIRTYNNKASLYDKTYTVFLLLGKGVRTPVNPLQPESCHKAQPEIAGFGKTASLPVPTTWQDSFLIKDSIVLQPGQKLFGVPIDVSNSELAEGHYVSLRRQVTAEAICEKADKYIKKHLGTRINKNSFITIKGKGIFVSGITNVYRPDDSTPAYNCNFHKERVGVVYARDAHQQIIRVEIAPASLHLITKSPMIDISNNELLQIQKSAISVTLKKPANQMAAILSGWVFDETLVRADGNHIYSCLPGTEKEKLEPALAADFSYRDYAREPKKIHTMELRNNLFITGKNSAVNITISANADATLSGNNMLAASDSLYGVALTGGQDDEKSDRTFYLEKNIVSGFRTSLLLNSSLSLVLNSNDLFGTQRAIERGDWQTDTLTLSGDNNNTYKKGIQQPCKNLNRETVAGQITFKDGTPCPAPDKSTTPSPGHE